MQLLLAEEAIQRAEKERDGARDAHMKVTDDLKRKCIFGKPSSFDAFANLIVMFWFLVVVREDSQT
jgi:hypothetical protein